MDPFGCVMGFRNFIFLFNQERPSNTATERPSTFCTPSKRQLPLPQLIGFNMVEPTPWKKMIVKMGIFPK